MLILRTGRLRCAIPLTHIGETMRALPLERLGGAPPFVAGVAVIRGLPAPVVDLGALLGIDGGAPPRRWVTLRVDGRILALAVEAVEGVRAPDAAALRDLPPLLTQAFPAAVERLGVLDRGLVAVIGAVRLVPDEVWSLPSRAEGKP